jgi:hypothetical protein
MLPVHLCDFDIFPPSTLVHLFCCYQLLCSLICLGKCILEFLLTVLCLICLVFFLSSESGSCKSYACEEETLAFGVFFYCFYEKNTDVALHVFESCSLTMTGRYLLMCGECRRELLLLGIFNDWKLCKTSVT